MLCLEKVGVIDLFQLSFESFLIGIVFILLKLGSLMNRLTSLKYLKLVPFF